MRNLVPRQTRRIKTLSFDDEVRRHLRDTGEQVTLTPGLVDAVRVRAATRARRRRVIFGGLSSFAAIAIVAGLATVFLGGTEQDSDLAEFAERREISIETKDSESELTQNSEAQPLVASADPAYETVPLSDDEAKGSAAPLNDHDQKKWIEVSGPVVGATTEYVYSGDTVLARVGSQWFVRDESSWRELDLPTSLEVIAVDLGVGEEFLRVAGWLGEDPCERNLVVQIREVDQWQQYEVPDQLPQGVMSSVSGARLRVTDHEFAMSRSEEIEVDPVCLLRSLGIDAVEAEIIDDLVYATDPKAGRVIHSLNKFGPLEAEEFIINGPTKRSVFVRSTDGQKWTTTPLPEYRIPEIGVVDGIVMIEDTEHTVHDGQRIKRTEVRPKNSERLIDAFVTSSGMAMLFERDQLIWIQDTSGQYPLEPMSSDFVLWGRLGRVHTSLTMIAETQQGQTLLMLSE